MKHPLPPYFISLFILNDQLRKNSAYIFNIFCIYLSKMPYFLPVLPFIIPSSGQSTSLWWFFFLLQGGNYRHEGLEEDWGSLTLKGVLKKGLKFLATTVKFVICVFPKFQPFIIQYQKILVPESFWLLFQSRVLEICQLLYNWMIASEACLTWLHVP